MAESELKVWEGKRDGFMAHLRAADGVVKEKI